jgi:hypothetical protein
MQGSLPQLLVVLAVSVVSVTADAQISFGGCFDAAGNAVPSVASPALNDVAFATVSPAGTPVILYNPRAIILVGPVISRFGYLHECAHHALGQVLMVAMGQRGPITSMDEQAADCAAIVWLVQNGEFGAQQVRQVQQFFYGNPGNFTHFPGPVRATNLGACLTSGGVTASGASSSSSDTTATNPAQQPPTPVAYNTKLRIWSKFAGNPAEMDVAVDSTDIGSISNLERAQALDLGALSPGSHTFALTDITGYGVNPYGQLVPIANGLTCSGSFNVTSAHTYQLVVRLLPDGRVMCAFR